MKEVTIELLEFNARFRIWSKLRIRQRFFNQRNQTYACLYFKNHHRKTMSIVICVNCTLSFPKLQSKEFPPEAIFHGNEKPRNGKTRYEMGALNKNQ